jgi:hypothetical protein
VSRRRTTDTVTGSGVGRKVVVVAAICEQNGEGVGGRILVEVFVTTLFNTNVKLFVLTVPHDVIVP